MRNIQDSTCRSITDAIYRVIIYCFIICKFLKCSYVVSWQNWPSRVGLRSLLGGRGNLANMGRRKKTNEYDVALELPNTLMRAMGYAIGRQEKIVLMKEI